MADEAFGDGWRPTGAATRCVRAACPLNLCGMACQSVLFSDGEGLIACSQTRRVRTNATCAVAGLRARADSRYVAARSVAGHPTRDYAVEPCAIIVGSAWSRCCRVTWASSFCVCRIVACILLASRRRCPQSSGQSVQVMAFVAIERSIASLEETPASRPLQGFPPP